MPHRLFIGSSSERLDVARAVRTELAHDYDVTLWTALEAFRLGNTTIESLEEVTATHDFAVLILDGDDIVESRGDRSLVPHDNVLFELGMFMGTLSRHQVFTIYPEDKKPKLPSDLAGMKLAYYRTKSGGKLDIGPACDADRCAITETGTGRHGFGGLR